MAGNGLAVVIRMAGLTVTVRLCDPLAAPAASVTTTEKLKEAGDVSTGAVPERTPAVDRLSHVGRPVACQVKGVVPPVSANVWLYAPPEEPSGSDVVVTAGVALMVNANVLVAEAERLSVTREREAYGCRWRSASRLARRRW